jgi:hypothetical protein
VTFTLFSPILDATMVDGGDRDVEGLGFSANDQFVGKGCRQDSSQP